MDIASFLSQNEVMLDVGTSDKTKLLPRRIIGGTRVDGKTSSVTDRRFGLRREQPFLRSRPLGRLGDHADLDDLRLDLVKAASSRPSHGVVRTRLRTA